MRVISDTGDNLGVLHKEEALRSAKKEGLDLVEVSPSASPPVCRITDYSRFKYEWKKRQKENKAKTKKVVVKEIRFGPNTNDHDFNFKTRHAINFLSENAKVKAYVHFAGRSILFKDRGRELLGRFSESLKEHGTLEGEPVLEGKRMSVIFAPKKNAVKNKSTVSKPQEKVRTGSRAEEGEDKNSRQEVRKERGVQGVQGVQGMQGTQGEQGARKIERQVTERENKKTG